MSRSYRKTKIFGNAKPDSEKEDKNILHGIIRAKVRNNLIKAKQAEDIEEIDPNINTEPNACYNVWAMGKDGRHYWKDATSKDMRKQLTL